MKKEIWKDIPQFEGVYQASTHGRIKSLDRKVWTRKSNSFKIMKGRILKGNLNVKTGYLTVRLYSDYAKKDFSVYVLVAMTFFGSYS